MTKLTFEEFKERYFKVQITPEFKKELNGMYSLDMDKEIESILQAEYDWYATMYEVKND